MADELEATRKVRRGIRSSVTKKCSEITEFVRKRAADEATLEQAKLFNDQLASLNSDLTRYNDKISVLVASDDAVLQQELDRQSEYRDAIINARLALESFSRRAAASSASRVDQKPLGAAAQHTSAGTAATPGDPSAQPGPPLFHVQTSRTIPKFSGDVRKFREWWQLYEIAVHSRPGLTDIERFWLLKESLSGAAAGQIAHLDISAEQYKQAIDMLKKKFGRGDDAERAHMQAIRQLCTSSDLQRPGKLNHFVSILEQNVLALVALGRSTETLSFSIAPMVVNCLPVNVRESFAAWYDTKKESAEYNECELQALITYLEKRLDWNREYGLSDRDAAAGNRASTFWNRGGNQFHDRGGSSNARQNSWKGDRNHSDFEKTKNFAKSYSAKKNFSFGTLSDSADHSCVFCNEEAHVSTKCKKVMSLDERKQKLRVEKACFRCLRRNHNSDRCRARIPNCTVCKENISRSCARKR